MSWQNINAITVNISAGVTFPDLAAFQTITVLTEDVFGLVVVFFGITHTSLRSNKLVCEPSGLGKQLTKKT